MTISKRITARRAGLTAALTAAAAAAALAALLPGAAQAAPARPAPGGAPALRAACAPVPSGYARCLVLYRPQVAVNRALAARRTGPAAAPAGLTAKDIEAAYRLPVSQNPAQTVAVVDAYNTPDLARYLATYRKQYGLPACTPSGGCLRQVNQAGKTAPLPASGVGTGWDVETTLDVAMVSVACPHCNILVVEADDNSVANLAAAEDTAVRLGADVVSNSYGGREDGQNLAYAKAYDHPGHVIVASSGDEGFTAANFPADLTSVTAAGGTELAPAKTKRGWAEQVWNAETAFPPGASSSGCSAYVPKPAWQHDPHCPMRTVADVSAVAANIPIYDKTEGGWLTVAGTSVSSPLIAGVYALAGNAATIAPGYPYAHAKSLFDITVGNNDPDDQYYHSDGAICGYDYLCVAKPGYDAPTGLGSPDGIGAF